MTVTLTSQADTPKQGWFAAFLKFGGLSGMGWLLDFALLLSMVGAFGVPPFVANVISSSTAALTVFLLSRRLIFDRSEGALGTRIAVYLVYTLCLITAAAWVMTLIIQVLAGLAQANGYAPSPAVLVLLTQTGGPGTRRTGGATSRAGRVADERAASAIREQAVAILKSTLHRAFSEIA